MKKNSTEIRFMPQRYSKTYSTNISEGKNGLTAFGKKDSSNSVIVEEENINDGEDIAPAGVASFNETSLEFAGVRFTPKVIEFPDAFEGKSFRQILKLQNVGKNPVMVRMGEPKSFIFQMDKQDHNTKILATGSTLIRTINYTYHNDDLVQRSVIPVQVNDRSIDYPIIVNKAAPVIEIIPAELDFKSISMGASAKTLKLSIHNTGGQGTKFTVDLGRNELDLVVRPMRGTIRAKAQINLYVEMMGVKEGEYFKELWITTSEQSIRVPVIAEVLRPRLEVYHLNKTGDFTLIDFPPTFIGTQRLETLVLRNFSAEMTPFVALAEINGEVKNMKEARKLQDAFRMFMLSTEEGRFEPFESKISTVMFKPVPPKISKGWHHKEQTERRGYEYLIFLRIIRVHCIERRELEKVESEINHQGIYGPQKNDKRQSIMASVASTATFSPEFRPIVVPMDTMLEQEDDYIRSLSDFLLEEEVTDQSDAIRLCIHGEAIEPNVLIQPSEIDFKRILVGEKDTKVIRVTNLSIISINCKFSKVVNVEVHPADFKLDFEKSREVTVCWTPTYSVNQKTNLSLKIYAESAVLNENDQNLVCVKTSCITLKMHADIAPKDVAPKIGLGITPLITNEVGILSEKVTFKSPYPKPKAAILESQKENHKPSWAKKGKSENAIIAFPNDRPRIFYNWPKDKVCRTIFTGNFRYSPPQDLNYTMDEKDFEKRKKEHEKWSEFLSRLSESRKDEKSEAKKKLSKHQFSCGKLHNMMDFKFPEKFVSQTAKSDQLNKYLNREINLSEGFLMPLSPLFLCNIKVEPKLIDLAMVAPNSSVNKTLKMHNMNSFPICIRFIPGKSGVTLPGGDTKIIPALGRKSLEIVFQTKDLGRYNGFLDYVINGSHQFKITISANVMPKTLILNDANFEMEFLNYDSTDTFQPVSLSIPLINRLQSPIKFHWDVPFGSSFDIEPISGEVPPLANLQNEIYFSPDPKKYFPTEVQLYSESGASQVLKLTVAKRKPKVYFLSNKIYLDNIPLNLREKTQAVIRNADYYDVIFEVLDFAPLPGVTITPHYGLIKSRGFLNLEICVQIPVLLSFSFEVTVRLQHQYDITLNVDGRVTYPQIRLTPTDVTMRRISAQSFDFVPMCVENYGSTIAHIAIDFRPFPEYSIGRKKTQINYSSQEDFYLSPGKCMKIFIRFEPSDIARHQFYLPIIINGILGPPFIQNVESELPAYYLTEYEEAYSKYGQITRSKSMKTKIPCAVINCTVVGHCLKISTLQVHFQPKKLSLIQFQSEEIKISNPNPNHVAFCIRTDDLSQEGSPFSLVIVDGGDAEDRSKSIKIELEPYESVLLRAEFTPCKCGIFSVELPIFLRGYNDGAVFNYISLNGEMKKPTLVVDVNEVHFPPLPLDVGSEVTVNVTAEYYQSQDVIYARVWDIIADKKNISESLHIKWLEEPYITGKGDRQNFQIRLLFQSSAPISLRTFILFSDSTGEYVSILVTASADNSAMTNHSFLSSRATKYKYVREFASISEPPEEPAYPALKRYSSAGKKMARFPDNSKKSVTVLTNQKNAKDVSKRDSQSEYTMGSRLISAALDPPPKLKIFQTKSATRLTQLNYYSLFRTAGSLRRDFGLRGEYSSENTSRSENLSNNTLTSSSQASRTIESLTNEITYPFFPSAELDSTYGRDMNETLFYVERWIYESVFHCDQYFVIPENCYHLPTQDHPNPKNKNKNHNHVPKPKVHLKNIFDLLINLAGEKVLKFFSERPPSHKGTPVDKMQHNYLTLFHLMRFLWVQGAVLGHIRPENLLTYEDYLIYTEIYPPLEKLSHSYDVTLKTPFKRGSDSTESLISAKSSPIEETTSRRDKSVYSLPEFWSKPLYDEFDFEKISKRESMMYQKKSDEDERASSTMQTTTKPERDYYYYNQQILDKTSFAARSTQAWLDVIIQLYRTLVLRKVVFKRTIPIVSIIDFKSNSVNIDVSESNSPPKKLQRKCSVSVLSFESYESNAYTSQERILLSWLNHHYELQRNVLWPYGPDCECLYRTFPRTVDNFTTHLSDGVVLTAATASHCPYLVPNHLIDVFPNPTSYEEIYHNAIKLTHAWRDINLGLTVEPKDIVQPNLVFMIMLIVHLYENLPTLSPRSIIRFSAPLTKEMFRTIQLTNNSDEKVSYEIKFIGNDGGFFRVSDSSKIYIKPKKSYEFKIFYHAKKIQKITAFLLLCGATESPKFAKHITLQLEGEPSELIESSNFKFTAKLYEMICMDIPIEPPNSETAEYEIWYGTCQPKVKGSQGLNSSTKKWEEIWNRKISRRLFLNQFTLAYKEGERSGILNANIMCLSLEEKSFWLLFRNPKLGDFIVKIHITPQLAEPTNGELLLQLPETWKRENKCTCSDVNRSLELAITTARCFLLTTVEIPAKNTALWEANFAMFRKTLLADERQFWTNHFETKIGIHLVSWLSSQDDSPAANEEFLACLSTSVKYHLKLDHPANVFIKIPSELKIPDVQSSGTVTLPLHISGKTPIPLKMLLTMTSENRREVRTIRIILQDRKSETMSVVSSGGQESGVGESSGGKSIVNK